MVLEENVCFTRTAAGNPPPWIPLPGQPPKSLKTLKNIKKPMVFQCFSIKMPKMPQDVSKMPQDASKMPQDASKMPQDASKTPKMPPRCLQDGPKMAQDDPRWPKMAPRCLNIPILVQSTSTSSKIHVFPMFFHVSWPYEREPAWQWNGKRGAGIAWTVDEM